MTGNHLQIVVCGAGPAADVAQLIRTAQDRGWTAAVTATADALRFVDVAAIEEQTGNPVSTSYGATATRRRVLASVDAVIIAPATYNTVNKLAIGIADSYVLSSVAELIGRGIPAVVVPFVNAALAARAPFQRSIAGLRAEGVRVLFGSDDDWEPHPPGTGAEKQTTFPWRKAFHIAEEMAGRHMHR